LKLSPYHHHQHGQRRRENDAGHASEKRPDAQSKILTRRVRGGTFDLHFRHDEIVRDLDDRELDHEDTERQRKRFATDGRNNAGWMLATKTTGINARRNTATDQNAVPGN
jgi:hypothetical protein